MGECVVHDWWGIGITDKILFLECNVDPCRIIGTVELDLMDPVMQNAFMLYPYRRYKGDPNRVTVRRVLDWGDDG